MLIIESANGNGTILFHCDASQAGGKVSVDTQQLGVDYLTMAGHKIYATKGVGILYIRDGSLEPQPIIHGANQEKGRRAGTENVILCVGMGKAAELIQSNLQDDMKRMRELKQHLKTLLLRKSPVHVRVNSTMNSDYYADEDDTSFYLSNTLSISFEGILSSSLLAIMNDSLCTSAGAACHSTDGISISDVLKAIQCPPSFAIGTLRLSVGRYTTLEDVEKAAEVIISSIQQLLDHPSENQKHAWDIYHIDLSSCLVYYGLFSVQLLFKYSVDAISDME